MNLFQIKEQDKKEKEKESTKRFALATALSGIGAGVGIKYGINPAFIKNNAQKYTNINTPEGLKIENAIIKAHKESTGLQNPQVATDLPGLPKHLKHGGYIPRHVMGASGLGKDINLPENEGLVIAGPTATAFTLAHELGHRAQDYQSLAGPSQLAGQLLPNLAGLAATTASMQAQTNRGALAKGLLASYVLNLPRIAAEIKATSLGNSYLKSAGVETSKTVSALQPLGYLLQPAAEGLVSIATGRVIKTVKTKLKNRKKQKEEMLQAAQ
jgi:hypothetical protein